MNANLRINADRLWNSLMAMAQHGATEKGGCNRQALTDEDKNGRDLFVQWCREAGCSIRVDEIGNIFARRKGLDETTPPVIAGSHLDTQPTGGKFDGVFGVLAALEVVRTLNDAQVETKVPVEIVVWTNEEGSRFAPALLGSGVWSGVFDLEESYATVDKNGLSIKKELSRIGYKGEESARAFPVAAAFEAHIEQGPILEQEEKPIGVVLGVQGMRWFDLIIEGQPCHAGPTPMDVRRDPVRGMASIISQLYDLIDDHSPLARVTFGDVSASPGSRNTVPETVLLNIDIRHPDQNILEEMDKRLREIVSTTCSKLRLKSSIQEKWDSPAVAFDDDCIEAVRSATQSLNYPFMEMFSGAGHDSVYVSRVCPTSMIFVPCEGGLSHNEAENASPKDLEAGCNVLLHAMLSSANR